MTKKEFYAFIEDNYIPSMYEINPERMLKAGYHAYGYSGMELYYEIYTLTHTYIRDNAKILDIGVYPGTFLNILRTLLKNNKIELYGIGGVDFSTQSEEDSVLKYNKMAGENNDTTCKTTNINFSDFMNSLNIKTYKVNLDYCDSYNNLAQELSFKEPLYGNCDIVTCMEVIEHLHTPYKLFDLMHSSLKKGGICVLETNNIKDLWGLKSLFTEGSNLDRVLCDKYKLNIPPIKHPHIRFYSINEIITLFQKAGFRIKKAYDFNFYIPLRYLSGLKSKFILGCHLLNMIPGFRSHIVIMAEKL